VACSCASAAGLSHDGLLVGQAPNKKLYEYYLGPELEVQQSQSITTSTGLTGTWTIFSKPWGAIMVSCLGCTLSASTEFGLQVVACYFPPNARLEKTL
jgi:hypothetical protein